MGSLSRAKQWLNKKWWGLIPAYLIICFVVFGGLWLIAETMDIPRELDPLPDFMKDRRFYHLILTPLIGALVTLFLDLILRRSSNSRQPRCEDFGIEILGPMNRHSVARGREFTLYGTFKKRPPGQSMKIFKVAGNNRYWPLRRNINFLDDKRKWQVQVPVTDKPGPLTLMVAVLGEGGHALWNYFEEIYDRHEGTRSLGITTLTPDILECGTVTVQIEGS
jgi:hypothetical protein